MLPGEIDDLCNHFNSKHSGLRLRKLRFARRRSNGVCALAVNNHSSPDFPNPTNEKEASKRPISTILPTSSSSSPSTSSPGPPDQHLDCDKAAGKSIVDDEAFGSQSEASEHGFISVMGRRREMEDAITAVPNLTNNESLGHGFYAVYDGHGGFGVAEKCRERLHHLVAEEMAQEAVIDWEKVMRMSFARMDSEVCDQAAGKVEGDTVGSTAVVAVVAAAEIVVANCGDSRAVLCRGGVAMPLSRDHKPERPDERERVEAAGGCIVDWNGPRVLGVLATSRSIEMGLASPSIKSREWASSMSMFMGQSNGDHCMRPYVISVPETTVCDRTQLDEFLILASDGLWDVVSNEMACELVKRCLLHEQRKGRRNVSSEEANNVECYATLAATMLAEMAISRGSKDNVSVIVVKLRPKV